MSNSEDMLSKLNEYQKQAVVDDSPACLVNANVGSGKTTVLISKVFYLHQMKSISFDDMVVLTFTNKAANEIKERITGLDTNINRDNMPYFGTFHSVALTLLKTILPVDSLGYTQDFAVIDPDEEIDMAARIISDNSLKIKYINKLSMRLEKFSQGRAVYANMKHKDDIEMLFELLQKEKTTQNKMNFEDLIKNAIMLLKNSTYHPKWIIIDEFQDCDESQLQLIKTLAGAETKIFAVGDPNQIIYSWRGSNQYVFSKFKREYNARELSLPINYRSCNTILEVAKCFLDTNADLSGLREQGGKITIKNHYNDFNEAQYLSYKIKGLVKNGVSYKDIAIFYRLQKQSKTLEDVFIKDDIPFEVSMRTTLKEIPVLGWFVKLLRFSVNTNDIGSAVFVLTHNIFGEQLSVSEVKDIHKNKDITKSVLYRKMIGFRDWCKNSTNLTDAYAYFEMDNYINPTSASFIENKELIQTLLKKINEYISLRKVNILVGVTDFINSSALYGIDILKDDVHINNDTVKFMTLHASKGLEFKYVFIIGVNSGLIPLHTNSYEDQDEERRLFFVGITRAKDFLEISYYTSSDDQRVLSGASRYISMIPNRLVEREEKTNDGVDLQALRREVSQAKDQKNIEEAEILIDIPVNNKQVKHPKYGIGIINDEDDDTVTVLFDKYGNKSFSKIFNPLEYL